jgi:F-type H+-transporting ATPase subunit epsilon
MHSFPFSIAAVDQVYFEGEVRSVTCPGSEGELTVLKDHEPFVSVLKSGTVVVCAEGDDKVFDIKKGILEVHRGGAVILL